MLENTRRSRRSVAENPIVLEVLAAAKDYNAVHDLTSDAEFEARVDAVTEQFGNVARRVWSQAPTSIADIVARAIIVETITGGTSEVQGLDPTAVCDSNAEAHLLDAIRKVLGGRKYPRRGA